MYAMWFYVFMSNVSALVPKLDIEGNLCWAELHVGACSPFSGMACAERQSTNNGVRERRCAL